MTLLAQGSYGCVYYPGHSCKTNKKDDKYVSKLSRDDKQSQVEYNIGQIVKKIPNYSKKFIIIEKKCKVKKPKIEDMKEGCRFIQKRDYPSYVLLYSKYLKSQELHDIIIKDTSKKKIIQIAETIYKRISDLYSVGIIHMDMHFANILVSEKNGKLYVIDFGLALDSNRFFIGNKLNLSYIKDKWFDYRLDSSSWTLEYIFIALMVQENQPLTKDNIMYTIKNYYNQNKVLNYILDDTYIQMTYDYYKPLENNTTEENIKKLLQYCNTWDYYKLAYNMIYYIRHKSNDFEDFKLLLSLMMHPIPEYRPTKEELKEHFKHYKD